MEKNYCCVWRASQIGWNVLTKNKQEKGNRKMEYNMSEIEKAIAAAKARRSMMNKEERAEKTAKRVS